MSTQTQDPYRACAGAVIFNRRGMYLVGERIRSRNQWQFPQVILHPQIWQKYKNGSITLFCEMMEWMMRFLVQCVHASTR
jgi:hypothetical protein